MIAVHEPASAIDKAPTGVKGFDAITFGGLPRHRTTLVMGGAGTGKTIFALQTLVNGASLYNEPGIFVTFEENSRRILANAATFGWNLPEMERRHLFFLDVQVPPDVIQSGHFDLNGMLAGIGAKVAEMGAQRIVFDSIDVLLSLLQDPVAEQREIYRLHQWLVDSALTGLITSKRSNHLLPALAGVHTYDFMQFMTDCVVELNHEVRDHVSLRHIRVVKYRGSNFAENEIPLVIGPAGIEIASIGDVDFDYPVFTERIATGVTQLDEMLTGGYYRGASILITGAPGTAKSTLCGAFVEAACQRDESALYISFDESGNEIVRNLASVAIALDAHRQAGRLIMQSLRSEARNAEEQLLYIRRLVERHSPNYLVIDPVSALLKAGKQLDARQVVQRLLYFAKSRGITVVLTSLLEEARPDLEATELQVSTLADTWLHLSYVVQGGERNRALTIVKSRGMEHSNQVRELILSSKGITLTDVYTAGGEVLMGTLRWEKEAAEQRIKEHARRDYERKRQEFTVAEAEIKAKIAALQTHLLLQQDELEQLDQEQLVNEHQWNETQRKLQRLRGVEADI